MSDIISRLEKIDDRISEDSFLANKGLSNEVGIHVFCYDPQGQSHGMVYLQAKKIT